MSWTAQAELECGDEVTESEVASAINGCATDPPEEGFAEGPKAQLAAAREAAVGLVNSGIVGVRGRTVKVSLSGHASPGHAEPGESVGIHISTREG